MGTELEAVGNALMNVADTIASELTHARDLDAVGLMLDIHSEAIRLSQAITEGIPVSLDAAEDLLRRYSEVPKIVW